MLRKLWMLGCVSLIAGYGIPAVAQTGAVAETHSPDSETIVGGRDVYLPSVPVLPIYYALPMVIHMEQDPSITSNTPLIDNIQDINTWAEAVRECAQSSPTMQRETSEGLVPFNITGQTANGIVKLNAGGKPICSNY